MPTEKPKKLCEVIKDREKARYKTKVEFYKKLIQDVVFKERARLVDSEGKACLTEDISIINFLDEQGVKLSFNKFEDTDGPAYYVYVSLKEG
jgi:hypothetical protein